MPTVSSTGFEETYLCETKRCPDVGNWHLPVFSYEWELGFQACPDSRNARGCRRSTRRRPCSSLELGAMSSSLPG